MLGYSHYFLQTVLCLLIACWAVVALDGQVYNTGCERTELSFALNYKPQISLSLNDMKLSVGSL